MSSAVKSLNKEKDGSMKYENITVADSNLKKSNFTLISNQIIDHPSLSHSAKFLLIYLLRQSTDWVFHDSVIMKAMGCQITKLKELFSELRVAGYVKTTPIRGGVRGVFRGSKRVFSDHPVFLTNNQKPCKNDLITESRDGILSVSPRAAPADCRLGDRINNTNFVTKNSVTNNLVVNNKHTETNKQEGESVCLLLIGELSKIGINRNTAISWQRKFGIENVRNKLRLLDGAIQKGKHIRSKAGWLNSSLREDFRPSEPIKVTTHAAHANADAIVQEAERRQEASSTPESRKAGRDALNKLRGRKGG